MSRQPPPREAPDHDHFIGVIAGRLRAVVAYSRDLQEDDREILQDLAVVIATLPRGSLAPMHELRETRRRRRWRKRNEGADLDGQGGT